MENPKNTSARRTRHVMPLGPRVLVQTIKGEDRSSAGLFLPPGAKEATEEAGYGKVIEVARASPDPSGDEFGDNVSGVPLGSNVLFPKGAGTPLPWDEGLRLLNVTDILAVVAEVSEDDAH